MAAYDVMERGNTMHTKDHDTETFNFSSAVSLPPEYYSIDQPKHEIAKAIKQSIDQQELSLRKLAAKIEGMSYPQISRVTRQENYNIETLLKILAALDLELKVQPKER